MKLKQICESVNSTIVYHGTILSNVDNILKYGLLPKSALDYRSRNAEVLNNAEGAIFISNNPGIALKYGDVLIEISFNKNVNQTGHDEEWLLHNDGDGLPAPTDNYEEFFSSIESKISRKLTTLERNRLINTYEQMKNVVPEIQILSSKEMLAQFRRILYNTKFSEWDEKTLDGNFMYSQPIKFKGNNKIIGIYLFDDSKCSKVIYKNGGTINLNDEIKMPDTYHG